VIDEMSRVVQMEPKESGAGEGMENRWGEWYKTVNVMGRGERTSISGIHPWRTPGGGGYYGI
jgi:hypothetical protein